MIDEPRRTDHCSVPGWRADPAIDHVSNAELGGSLAQHGVRVREAREHVREHGAVHDLVAEPVDVARQVVQQLQLLP